MPMTKTMKKASAMSMKKASAMSMKKASVMAMKMKSSPMKKSMGKSMKKGSVMKKATAMKKSSAMKKATAMKKTKSIAMKKATAKKPAAKKAAAKEAAAKEEKPVSKKVSSLDAHFARVDEVMKQHESKCLGELTIVGVLGDDEDSDDDDTEYTAEQIARIRTILINASRDKELKSAMKFATCGQDEDIMQMYNTSTGNTICAGIPGEVKKAFKKQSMPERFDALMALTFGVYRHDSWMHDNECWGPGEELDQSMKVLAKAWRETLALSDSELGIDSEFTRPGVEALCEKLEEEFQKSEPASEFAFNWRPTA